MPATTPRPPRAARAILGLATGLALVAITALPAVAEVKLPSGSGVQVGGELTNTVEIEKLSTSSDGPKARTTLRLGGVERSSARGSVTNTTEIGELILHAEGRGAVSETVIGTVRDVESGGSIANSVTVGSSLNVAIGDGARACTEIGTMGRATCR